MQYLAHEDDPKNRIIKFYNASKPVAWPKAASEYLCIFEAINLIGSALFDAEWTGSELDAIYWPEGPKQHFERVSRNSGGGAPGGARRSNSTSSMIAQDLLPREWTHQHNCHVIEWRLEQRQFKWEQNMQAGRRLREAVNWLAQRCRDGQLVSYARFRTGGHLWPMAAWEWNVDDPLPKFVIEGGHKRYFSELKSTGPFEVYLFFTRAELVAAFNRLKLAPVIVPAADLSRLSPFLQFAVLLARKNGYYSKAQCETQAVREAEVRAVWSVALPDVPATENSVQLVARIMGFPDPVAIKRGQKARRSGKRVEG